jgi:hypothetical protein
MNYANLVAAIEAIALSVGVGSFWSGIKAKNGINYDQPFPVCEFFVTQPSQLLATTVRYSIGMGFYGKDSHENNNDDSLQIQSEMDELTQKFVMELREQGGMELVGDTVSRIPVIRDGSKVGTGLFIDFTLDVPLLC